MAKVFISQQMKGLTDEQIMKVRNAAIQKCKVLFGEGVEIIDSYKPEVYKKAFADGQKNVRVRLLGAAIKKMADADVVVFVGNPLKSPGTETEFEVANRYDMVIIPMSHKSLGVEDIVAPKNTTIPFVSCMGTPPVDDSCAIGCSAVTECAK